MTKIIFLFVLINTYAHAGNIDSLKHIVVKYTQEDSTILSAYTELAISYYSINLDLSFTYADSALYIANKLNDKKSIAFLKNLMGGVQFSRGNYKSALSFYLESERISVTLQDTSMLIKTYNNQGMIYRSDGKYKQAMSYYEKALKLSMNTDSKRDIAITKHSISSLYMANGVYDMAEQYLLDAIEILKELDDKEELASVYDDMAGLKINMGKNNDALRYYKMSIDIFEDLNSQVHLAYIYNNIGSLYAKMGDYQKSMRYFTQGVSLADSLRMKKLLVHCYINLSISYSKLGNKHLAIEHIKIADSVSKEVNSTELSLKTAYSLYNLFFNYNDYKNALAYYQKYVDMKFSLDSISKEQRIDSLMVAFNSKIDRKENEILKKDNNLKEIALNKQQLLIYLIIIVAISFVILSATLFLRYKDKKMTTMELKEKNDQIENANIELNTLNQQIYQDSQKLIKLNDHLALSEKQLSEANKTKDQFFSMIAHDLRNPIGGILNISDLLANEFQNLDDTQKESMSQSIYSTSKHTLDLLENLLSWSRLQSNKIIYEPDIMDIGHIIDKNISILNSVAKKKNITIEKQIREKVCAFVDPSMVSTIIRNLLTNALKFTANGGHIEIICSELSDNVSIEIIDNGIGMTKDQVASMLNPDIKFTNYGTNQEKGTGLGFLLILEFIKLNNGIIEVKSELNIGTAITITIPKNKN